MRGKQFKEGKIWWTGPWFVAHSLLVKAYQHTTGAKDVSGLNTWAEKQEAPMFKYLLGISDHIMNVNGETLLYSFCFRSCALFTVASRIRTRAERPCSASLLVIKLLANEQTNKLIKSKSGLAEQGGFKVSQKTRKYHP